MDLLHHTLATSSAVHPDPHNWARHFKLAMLSIRAMAKEDFGCSITELYVGTTLRLPVGEVCFCPTRRREKTHNGIVRWDLQAHSRKEQEFLVRCKWERGLESNYHDPA